MSIYNVNNIVFAFCCYDAVLFICIVCIVYHTLIMLICVVGNNHNTNNLILYFTAKHGRGYETKYILIPI